MIERFVFVLFCRSKSSVINDKPVRWLQVSVKKAPNCYNSAPKKQHYETIVCKFIDMMSMPERLHIHYNRSKFNRLDDNLIGLPNDAVETC